MSHLRKIPFTKPIPAGAEMVTRRGVRLAHWTDGRGKAREAELTEDGQRIRQFSRKWYGEYVDADGITRCVPLATDKTAAQQMLAALTRRAELGKAGCVDPFEQHRKRPLAEHLADFAGELQAKGDDPRHVGIVASRLAALLGGCGFVFLADLSASRIMDYLAELRRDRPATPLPIGEEWFTPREAAGLLGIKTASVAAAVRRHRLDAEGQGKARRLSARDAGGAARAVGPRRERRDDEPVPGARQGVHPLAGQGPSRRRRPVDAPGSRQQPAGPPPRPARADGGRIAPRADRRPGQRTDVPRS